MLRRQHVQSESASCDGAMLVMRCAPETKGLTLEQIQDELTEDQESEPVQ